jgi:hypothetical protein
VGGDGIDLGSFAAADFRISDVEPSGFTDTPITEYLQNIKQLCDEQ